MCSVARKRVLYPLPFENARIKVCDADVNPWHLLAETTDLYTVSSLMGFEALLADVKVHCFGIPFYAGWGLTCLIDKSAKDVEFQERSLRYFLLHIFNIHVM